MPTTYNGIGTHYYGKKNLEKRPAPCPHCGRGVELTSYDTRLWFVIFFIPVIPLGRKRIIDYCPSCSRHFVMELGKWETTKQLEISGALEQFRSNPTPEAAMQAHQQLINFHQTTQAAEFQQMMRQKFADNAKVQAYLGAALEHLGQFDEAASCYARALQVRPDLPEARVGVAEGHIRAQRLDEARKLLDFLEKPGAAQLYSLEPLETLARAFQQANRHDEALQVFGRLQEELPQIGQVKAFRDMVKKSEKGLHRKETILPKQQFSWRRLFGLDRMAGQPQPGPQVTWRGMAIFGVIVALVLLGLAISNEYIRRHRTLHIVNGFTQKATIEVRGASSVQAGRGITELVLPEGRHHASITGPVRQEVDFEIRSGYFNRWFSDPAWVLNVGGAAVLLFTDVVYTKNPRPAAISFHFGEAFQHFPKVTNPFQPLPDSLRMKEHEERTLTHLDLFTGEPADVFQYFRGQNQTEQALHFAEWRLGIQPDDEVVLRSYVVATGTLKQSDRAEKFLTSGLTNRPVRIEWHRAYQSLHKDRRRDARLAVEYDAMLRAEPTNSALLYLRGRISGDHAEGRRYFERSRETDPRNPYPLYALGYDRMAVADFAGAKTLLARSAELSPKDTTFIYFLETARLALGESAAVEQELRAGVKREPLQPGLVLRLSNTLVAQGKNAEAQQVIAGFERAASAQYREAARDMNNALHRHLLYATGDFAALEKHAAGDSSPGGRQSLFEALIEQGRMEEAVKIQPMDGSEEEKPFQFLTVAVAWRHAGKTEEAEEWLARALKSLDNGNDDYARTAALLRRPTEPTRAELDDVILSLRWKAILCGALAQKHASKWAELAAAARRLNVERVFPYHLVQRVTAEAR